MNRRLLLAAISLASILPLTLVVDAAAGRFSGLSAENATTRAAALQSALHAATAEAKVRAIVGWTNHNLTWTYTDYKTRTAAEILERGGGNCSDQALVVVSLFQELGVKTRRVHEINIQPLEEGRQKGAEALISKLGLKASVFGLRHNDHVWIEFFDGVADEWLPADPTLNLVGLDAWIRARVGFDARPTHAILASRDMIVPIAIFAEEGSALESRTEHYLVRSFDHVYHGRLSSQPAWAQWVSELRRLDPICYGAMLGRVNLHKYAKDIGKLEGIYRQLNGAMS